MWVIHSIVKREKPPSKRPRVRSRIRIVYWWNAKIKDSLTWGAFNSVSAHRARDVLVRYLFIDTLCVNLIPVQRTRCKHSHCWTCLRWPGPEHLLSAMDIAFLPWETIACHGKLILDQPHRKNSDFWLLPKAIYTCFLLTADACFSNAKLFLFACPNWYLMHELERAMYLNENTKRIFEIGSKVKKLWDIKHVYCWYLFVTFFSLFSQKHVLHRKNINLLISKRLNGFNKVLVIWQICDSVKGYHKFIVTMIFPLISKP